MILYDAERDGAGRWSLVSDRVMGGRSAGVLALETVGGRAALRLTGDVSLGNDGGFLQMARDLDPAPGWDGVEIAVFGNDEVYNLHLRTTDMEKPWQSFRASFRASPAWRTLRLRFAEFEPHRISADFDAARLRRLGLVAIGRAFRADLSLCGLALFRAQ